MIAWDKLHCRFERCSNPVVGIYHAPQGCVCFSDPVQALCLQHMVKAAGNVQEFEPIVEMTIKDAFWPEHPPRVFREGERE